MDENDLDGFETRLQDVEAMSPEAQDAARQAEEAEAARGTVKEQAEAWAVIPQMIGGFVLMIAPELAPCYTDAKCLQWGERMVPVALKRGWDKGPDSLPEIALIASSLGFAVPTYLVVRNKLAAAKAAKAAAQPAQAAQPEGGAS